jgi:hypothetical protein
MFYTNLEAKRYVWWQFFHHELIVYFINLQFIFQILFQIVYELIAEKLVK